MNLPRALKRDAILEAALQTFEEQGFQRASMDEIAAKAQVSKRTVYNHFESKQTLFDHVAKTIWEQAQAATDIPFDSNRPIREQLFDLAMKELALVCDPTFIGQIRMLVREFMLSPEMAQDMMERLKVGEQPLTQWMQQATANKLLNCDDPEEAGQCFHGLIKAKAFWPQLLTGQPSPAQTEYSKIAERSCTMFLSIYGV